MQIRFSRLFFMHSIALLMLIVGLYLVPIGIFETDFSKIPGDLGDARFNNYILEHGHRYISGEQESYWNAPFMYPYENTIAFSDNLLGTLPAYSFFRMVGFDRETAFQYWILLLFVLNFVAAYWVLFRWTGNHIPAAVGAYIFAFSIMLVGNIYNVQTLPRFILPFLMYWLWKYLSTQKTKYLGMSMLGLVFQFYCGIYLGFMAFYVMLFFAMAFIIVNKSWKSFALFVNRRSFVMSGTYAVLAALILIPLLYPYYEHSRIHGMRTYEEVVDTIPRLRSYFFTDNSPVLWSFLSEHGKGMNLWWCHFLFVGAIPWLAIAASPFLLFSKRIKQEQKKLFIVLLSALFLSILFSTAVNDWSLYKAIYKIPGFSSMRSVNRLINTEIFLFILVLVFFFKEIYSMSKTGRWVVYILPFLVIADNLINPNHIKRFEKAESQNRIERMKENIGFHNINHKAAFAYMPLNILGDEAVGFHLDAMLASQDLNISCVNAYTGSFPEKYSFFYDRVDYTSLSNWLNRFGKIPEDICVVNESKFREQFRYEIFLKSDSCYLDIDTENNIKANMKEASGNELFTLILFTNGSCAIQSSERKFLSIDMSSDQRLQANRNAMKEWEIFGYELLEDSLISFKGVNNKYWSVHPENHQIFSTADHIGVHEQFRIIAKP
jgi:hypothetical protein